MKKIIITIWLVIAGVQIISAQCDSSLFVNSEFSEQKITEDIVLRQYQFTDSSLFNSNQFISVLSIKQSEKISFGVVADTILRHTSSFAQQYGAIAAINGSFFKYNVPYNSVDYLRISRQELAPNQLDAKGQRQRHQLGAVAVRSGFAYVLKADELATWEKYIDADDILTSGPYLVSDGARERLREESFYTLRHPRTAVGTSDDSIVYLVIVDGRAAQAAGMSLKELQSIMVWIGVDNAINLDGGGSSAMYIEGFGIVNHPTDNRTFDNQGERKVANAIAVYSR